MGATALVRRQPALAVDEFARALTRSEMLGYLDYRHKRIRDTLAGMTDEHRPNNLGAA